MAKKVSFILNTLYPPPSMDGEVKAVAAGVDVASLRSVQYKLFNDQIRSDDHAHRAGDGQLLPGAQAQAPQLRQTHPVITQTNPLHLAALPSLPPTFPPSPPPAPTR